MEVEVAFGLDEKDSSFNSTKQFGVLDLMLLTLSIAYVCGLVMLGQKTTLGDVLLEGTTRYASLLVSIGLISFLFSSLGAFFFLVIVFNSPRLAPRLLLVMNLVTVLGCQIYQFLPQIEYEEIILSAVVAYGTLLFLPAWLVHNRVVGGKLTETHWLTLFLATFCNVSLISFIGLRWVLMGV